MNINFLFSSLFFFVILLSIIVVFLKNIKFYKILILCFFIRLIFIFININFFILPDCCGDAFNWEWNAWNWAKNGLSEVYSEVAYLSHGNSWTYSKFISFIYLLTGRNYILIILINLSISFYTLHWLIKICNELKFTEKETFICAVIFIISPSLINYSSVTLREVYIIFMITIIVYYLLLWIKEFDIKYFIILSILFYINNYLHEAIFTGVLLLTFFQVYHYISSLFYLRNTDFITKIKSTIFLLSLIVVIFFNHDRIPYLDLLKTEGVKGFQGIPQCEIIPGCEDPNQNFVDSLMNKTKISHAGSTAYPHYLVPQNNFDTFILTIPRIIYFYTGPFIFDIKKFSHIYLYLDSLFYTFFILVILINIKYILKNKYLFILCIFLIYFSFIFSFGTSNFGSSYRHRSKFIIFFIVIVTPFISKYFENYMKKINNYLKK